MTHPLYQTLGSDAEQVNAETPAATVWRYMVRREKGHDDWAVVYIESSGRLLIHSDWGSFGYRWDAIGTERDAREWFADLLEREAKSENTYAIARLAAGRRDAFDSDKAADWLASKGVDEEDVHRVRDAGSDEEAQGIYYSLAHGLPGDPPSFTGPPRELEGLRDSIFSRLAKLIREHIAADANGG